MSKLVIVESPAKAKTIEKYLPKGYKVRASMGHVRDLPDNAGQMPEKYKKEAWASLGVNVDKDFEAVYVVKDPKSKKSLTELRKELADADELLLATDEDREGEAISWHLLEALKPKMPVRRMVFNEITKTAINDALNNTRDLDTHLVEAQETRRILDRLVGYPLSLLVAKKIKYGLSAGRVQSPAVWLLVERERERRRFKRANYWDIKAHLKKGNTRFDADLVEVDGKRVATGKDFDESTGKVAKGKDVLLLSEKDARVMATGLQSANVVVHSMTERQYKTSPKAPFTTSTLQQEASRKLNLSARDAMSIAQSLYENGFITYMRTDSTNLSQQAIDGARDAIKSLYGDAYLPDKPRIYASKSKGAQEAHEAIRPTGDSFTHPDKTGLRGKEKSLYDLIWKRTVACQMNDAQKTSIRVDFAAEIAGKQLGLRANGNRIDFPGFIRAYVEGTDDPEASLEDKEVILPDMKDGEKIPCEGADALEHETKPPARFTEASLVQKLEEEGIGRPSTYATILGKIADGRFARKEGKTLVPTYMAFAVCEFLETFFPELVDLKFTARMEDDLDAIAQGSASKVKYLHDFYRKEGAFRDQVDSGDRTIEPDKVRVVNLEEFDGTLRVGRYGAYAQLPGQDGELKTVNVPDSIPPADLSLEKLQKLLDEREKGPASLGDHPETGLPILLMKGRFGPYLQLGERTDDNPKPRTASIPKNVSPEDLSLSKAVEILSLPRVVGKHPDDKVEIEAGIGRFGPFVKHGKEYRNLGSPAEVFTVTLEEALALLKEPKGKRRGAKVLRELGKDPSSGDEIASSRAAMGPTSKPERSMRRCPRALHRKT
ncbi:MAG: type I DNA topoisomerase [bacterium]